MTPEAFRLRLAKDCAVPPGAHVLAAVSGGADSMALLFFFEQIRESYPLFLSCAHVEHGIRGEESLADLAFVRQHCAERHIPFYAQSVDAPRYARENGCGMEEAARILRYAFLQETADRIGADVIALAHHGGDQAETVLLHAVRGCDVRGLCAMRMRSDRMIRPLLDCTADELRAVLVGAEIPWREDATNADVRYARNRMRHCVMPQLERLNPGAAGALCRLAAAAQRDEDFFSAQINALQLQAEPLVGGAAIRREAICMLHPALLGRVLLRLCVHAGIAQPGARETERLLAAVVSGGKLILPLPGGAQAIADGTWLCLLGRDARARETALSLRGETQTPFGSFFVRAAAPGETGDGMTAQRIPLKLLEGARITGRREGDTMIPFGKRSGVRLKKLLIDAGIGRGRKESIPILRDARGEILWAVGLRPAQACAGEETPMIVTFRRAEDIVL
ncbi:MAG: tRNA lysidine(34) synthetase TilS [Clostridia bacterium]|nr:tRNA lysidine(34) synthetase TilS [Clostridia bacterium]